MSNNAPSAANTIAMISARRFTFPSFQRRPTML
jgi:hypothetical protein